MKPRNLDKIIIQTIQDLQLETLPGYSCTERKAGEHTLVVNPNG